MGNHMQNQGVRVFKRRVSVVATLASLYLLIKVVEVLFSSLAYFEFNAESPTRGMLHLGIFAAKGFRYSSIVGLFLYIICGILFLVMIYRVVVEAKTFAVPFDYCPPGAAVGYWFIPLANFVLPYRVMRELYRSISLSIDYSAEKMRRDGILLTVWWCVFLFAGLLGMALTHDALTHPKTLHEIASVEVHLAVTAASSGITAFLFLLVLRKLREIHILGLEHQQSGSAPASVPNPMAG